MHAIFDDRNQQFRATTGDRLRIPLRADLEPGAVLTFDKVFAVTGEEPRVGTPFLEGVSVTARVLGTVKGQKLIVQKFKRRKNYRRRQGHRTSYTEILVESIQV